MDLSFSKLFHVYNILLSQIEKLKAQKQCGLGNNNWPQLSENDLIPKSPHFPLHFIPGVIITH